MRVENGQCIVGGGFGEQNGFFQRPRPAFSGGLSEQKIHERRYTLLISSACPLSHRILILRALYGLEAQLPVIEMHPIRQNKAWSFQEGGFAGHAHLYELYLRTDPKYSGLVTVPALWDHETETIVANDPQHIINELLRIFPYEGVFSWRPADLVDSIDHWNEQINLAIHDGVYRVGLAQTQADYDQAFADLFRMLVKVNDHLQGSDYLVGDHLTEADWMLFVTLVRFDAVYNPLFRCNGLRLVDYPELFAYARELYQIPQVANTVDFEMIKEHYYLSYPRLNPSGIVPRGPVVNWLADHGRFIYYL